MKRLSKNGNIYYRYYRKKRYKRKRGPKKHRKYPPYLFRIIKCSFQKQKKFIGRYHNLEELNEAKEKLIEKNNSVVFPKKYHASTKEHKVIDYIYEYVILKKNETLEDNTVQLRDEYGKLVDHTLNDNEWLIFDKFQCLEEETFWVYGYNNKKDRKTFQWIYDNLIANNIEYNSDLLFIVAYNNKIVIKYDTSNKKENFNLILCKNVSDSIRMYNMIEEWTKKDRKIKKNIIMLGGVNGYSERGKKIIEELKQNTNLDTNVIVRKVTKK